MTLDHDRAARGECRGGVPAGGGEGERKIAGAEDGDRAQRHHPLPEVGSWEWRALGQRRVEPDPEVVAVPDHVGEEP